MSVSFADSQFERRNACVCPLPGANNNVYRLELSRLSQDLCHVFYAALPGAEELIVANAIEFTLFHPKTERSKDFNISYERCGELLMCAMSFPKKHLAACQMIAKAFSGTIVSQSRHMQWHNTHIHLPQADHLFIYKSGKNDWLKEQLAEECAHVRELGTAMLNMTVD
jgi:hypothetical protein